MNPYWLREYPGKSFKNRQHETMTRIRCGQFTVRVWAIAKEFEFGPDNKVLEKVFSSKWTIEELIKALDSLDHIAAYEILDDNGNGLIVYPDWK